MESSPSPSFRMKSGGGEARPAPFSPGEKHRPEEFLLGKVIGFTAIFVLTAATAAGLPHPGLAASRNGLWMVVHDICLPAYRDIGVAFPCTEVNIADGPDRGFAVLRTPSAPAHIIVVPTAPISGIESPALLSEHVPNYWEAAWGARRFVEEAARRQLPRDNMAMAINSAAGRSQDQLHIHVSCIAPALAEFLRRHEPEIRETWSPLGAPLLGHRFLAMKVETENLAGADPFKLLARGLPASKSSMGRHMLAVTGATFHNGRSGFYLLTNDPRPLSDGIVNAEALLDANCSG